MIFEDRIQVNPRLFRLKDPRTNEIVDFEIQDLLPEEIIQEGTEVGARELNGQIVNEHSESTSNTYSCNYFEPVDISSLITKSSKVGTVYALQAYKKGSRCYFSAQFDLLQEGSGLFTIDASLRPKYFEVGTGINYQAGSSEPIIIKISANTLSIDSNVYASALKSYAIIHIEWEV